jgi:trans-aconitate methyltransferase
MLYTIVDSLAKKYLSKCDVVWEFGCGTGHNLWRIKKVNPDAQLVGADWTKSSNKMVDAQGFMGVNVDFFNLPKWDISTEAKTGVYTVAALEQTGTNFKKFVNWLIKAKPSIVVNIEPIPEMLDSSKLLDYLSIQYMHKRKYLRGYVDYLEELEKKGKIKIIEKRRSGIGSYLIDGYSIVVWKPLN